MNKIIQDIGKILYAVALYAIKHEEPGNGQQKKQKVVDDVVKIISEPGGIDVPQWALSIIKVLLPYVVDFVVSQLNKAGFFVHSGS
ncbi:MAG: hypothetical protein D6752_02425 [Candidatus Nitrosothermus koennekii]|nr:MAG: hypothetical protein D6752_02425 [Candidatus Nitrosothermus koennekii]